MEAETVGDAVPHNAVLAAIELIQSGRTQMAMENLRVVEIHLRTQLKAAIASTSNETN